MNKKSFITLAPGGNVIKNFLCHWWRGLIS